MISVCLCFIEFLIFVRDRRNRSMQLHHIKYANFMHRETILDSLLHSPFVTLINGGVWATLLRAV